MEGDSSEHPERSIYILYENDTPLKPGHWAHDFIRQYGKGAYSHWGKALYFSTSDNSNPITNGRVYRLKRNDLLKAVGIIDSQEEASSQESQERATLRTEALKKLGLRQAFCQNNQHLMRMGNKKAEILDFGILDEAGNRTTRLTSGDKYTFFFKAVFYQDVDGATFGFVVRSLKGVDLFGTTNFVKKMEVSPWKTGDLIETRLDVSMWLTNGIYFLTVATADPFAEDDVQYDIFYDGLQFEVLMKEGIFTTSIVNLDAKMVVHKVN
jgi:hypothetical protein